jgi:hypothetical protein
LLNIHLNSSKLFSFIENNVVGYYLINGKTNLQIEKAELEAVLEAEALTAPLYFCWKQKCREQKRKRLGWKRKQEN